MPSKSSLFCETKIVRRTCPFPDTRYAVMDVGDIIGTGAVATHNMVGIHTRGSGWTPMNEYYQFPDFIQINDSVFEPIDIDRQQAYVDSLLLNEEALELAFEGTRFYDLMRFAMRQDNPGAFMAKAVYARRGEEKSSEVQAEVKANLADQHNWYLRWKGKIGY